MTLGSTSGRADITGGGCLEVRAECQRYHGNTTGNAMTSASAVIKVFMAGLRRRLDCKARRLQRYKQRRGRKSRPLPCLRVNPMQKPASFRVDVFVFSAVAHKLE